jgi:cyanophycin synthetase
MQKTIDILRVTPLRGPNMWTYDPVLEALIDIGALEDFPSDQIPGFPERLAAWLPTLIEHRCSYEERGGFLRRLNEGTWPGHILEHVTLELQALAGMPGGFGRARETAKRGVYKVVVTSWHDDVTGTALSLARDLVLAAMDDRPFDVDGAVSRLRRMSDSLCLGPSTATIVAAALARRIPAIRLTSGNLVQLGYGKRQRRIWTAETDRTSAIAEGISRDKDLTKSLLAACGVPVPAGRMATSAADAWDAAGEVGLPVVVKPQDGNHGRGVFLGLSTQAEVEAAFAVAAGEGSGVLVERFVRGDEHRLLVVGGRMVAAACGEAAWITGDGQQTVLALVEAQLNTDPRRGTTESFPLNPVRMDSAVRLELSHQGLTPESVPPEGTQVLIQRNGNMSLDVTDKVHPDVAAMAVLAARLVGLDIAGIDLVAEDISRPLAAQRGAIVEVNAGPGLTMHMRPANGPGRPVGAAIVDHLFPEGDDGRIPVVGIAGSHGGTLVARLVAHLVNLGGACTGLACRDGRFIDRRCIDPHDAARFESARQVLVNRSTEVAVIENGLVTMATEGLAYDRCQVGVVTGLDPAVTLPDRQIETPEDLAKVLRTQVDVVLPGGAAVLNADDAAVAEMASLCDGEVLFFACDPCNPVLTTHLAAGGRGVCVRDGRLVLAHGRREDFLGDIGDFPVAGALTNPDTLAPLLAAVGAAWALGLSTELIRSGIGTFDPAHPRERNQHPWK